VHRDQLGAQHSVISLRKLYLLTGAGEAVQLDSGRLLLLLLLLLIKLIMLMAVCDTGQGYNRRAGLWQLHADDARFNHVQSFGH